MTTLDFAWQHRSDDPVRLLLGKAPEGVDLRLAAQQIEGWQTARHKWPSLSANPLFMYPPRLNREQASSEATAAYKATLMTEADTSVADLTGGMGIDTMAMARVARHMDYFELNASLCDLMTHNAETLGLDNISVHHGDGLAACGPYDFVLIDPARRDSAGRRVAAFEDCTPDIIAAMPRLRSITRRLMIKASPMVDITLALKQLPAVDAIHIVALRGECKELLFVIDFDKVPEEPIVHCVNLEGGTSPLAYRPTEAHNAVAPIAESGVMPRYLFEPDATIMKAGCHALIASKHGLSMLSHNSHLYCGEQPLEGFPGRTFEVIAEAAPTRKALTPLLPEWKANIISRNSPLSADALRRQLRLNDGGDLYILATSVIKQTGLHPTVFVCHRC